MTDFDLYENNTGSNDLLNELSEADRKKIRELSKNLAEKLQDKETMQKYGTSFQEGMTHDFIKSLERRYVILNQEFQEIDTDDNGTISKEEILRFFRERMNSGKEDVCDEKYIERLFYTLDRDHDSRITPEEFIFSYMELEQKLKLKMKKLQHLNGDLEDSLKEYQERKEEQKDEKLNTNGVCDNASLSITLYEAKDLRGFVPNTSPNAFIEFILEGKKQQSRIVRGATDPKYIEDFTFPVTNRNEELIVKVYDQNSFSGTQEIAKISINLELLEHQMKTENWYSLNNEGGTPDGRSGSIRLRLRYIYSWKKYYTNLVAKTEDQIKRLKKDIKDIRTYQAVLNQPFGIIKSGSINGIIDTRLFDKSEDIVEYINSTRRSVYVSGLGSNMTDSVIKINDNKKEDISWGKDIKITWVVLCATICLTFIQRGDFIGLAILFAILLIFLRNNKNDYESFTKYAAYSLAGSCLFDFLWLGLNFDFWNNKICEDRSVFATVYIFYFINIIGKIILFAFLLAQIKKFRNNRGSFVRYSAY